MPFLRVIFLGWEFQRRLALWSLETLPTASIMALCLMDSLGFDHWHSAPVLLHPTSTVEELGLPWGVVSMGSPGFPKEDTVPTFLVPCSYGAVSPPLYVTTLYHLYMESLQVPYQVSARRDPQTPTIITTRSHKHDLFL